MQHNDFLGELRNQFENSSIANSTAIRIFALNELINLAEKSGLAEKLHNEIQTAQKIINTLSLSLTTADYLLENPLKQSQSENTFFKVESTPSLYGIYFKGDFRRVLALSQIEKIKQFWQRASDDFTDELVFCRIYDNTDEQIAGDPKYYEGYEVISGTVFSTLDLKDHFSGWKAELYLRLGVFQTAADKKRIVYIWIAVLVIIFMLASTLLASSSVLKQAKLNRLKNDFIATVSHELKTPLASMRVLADTLLEGNYNDQQQATEYLQLICKENKRLSGLIDNFLTFSRMERNKQAFDIVLVNPAEIAQAAIDAIKTKFDKRQCKYEVEISEKLPDIMADYDAMVTVLVNLLDNACKYSYDNKQIQLKVFSEDNWVCFSVIDNGIGMTRRQIRKIFNRFYQADSTLSRRAEGTGLGLSIVKFIVDAHKGKIQVQSQIGKGSLFTVSIPVYEGKERKS